MGLAQMCRSSETAAAFLRFDSAWRQLHLREAIKGNSPAHARGINTAVRDLGRSKANADGIVQHHCLRSGFSCTWKQADMGNSPALTEDVGCCCCA